MFLEDVRTYCLSKKAVTEHFPFDNRTLVFKVMNKMFALMDVQDFDGINLKCDPERAIELREHYVGITPGYHMNKKLWNTVSTQEDVSDELLIELIDHSYQLIIESLPKKLRDEYSSR